MIHPSICDDETKRLKIVALPLREIIERGRVLHPKLPLTIRAFVYADESAVIELWQQCNLIRPWNDPQKDIQRKLAVQPHLFLVGIIEDELVATVMAGYEGHRGWINYLAVAPKYQRQGIGQRMMAEAERLLQEAGCPKINLQVRSTNQSVIEFYQRLGYTFDEVISLGKRLELLTRQLKGMQQETGNE